MECFEQFSLLHTSSDPPFQLFKALDSAHHYWVLFKVHTCLNLEEVNQLLKTGVHVQQSQLSLLLPPFVSARLDRFPPFTLAFQWKFTGEDYLSVLELPWDMAWRSCKTDYIEGYVKSQKESTTMREAFSSSRSLPVILKTYRYSMMSEVNVTLREVFAQSRMNHENICKLLDITLCDRGVQSRNLPLSLTANP